MKAEEREKKGNIFSKIDIIPKVKYGRKVHFYPLQKRPSDTHTEPHRGVKFVSVGLYIIGAKIEIWANF